MKQIDDKKFRELTAKGKIVEVGAIAPAAKPKPDPMAQLPGLLTQINNTLQLLSAPGPQQPIHVNMDLGQLSSVLIEIRNSLREIKAQENFPMPTFKVERVGGQISKIIPEYD